ncbi:hypothetical protein OJAV_G00230320 [Oryzias javanicus]|uniref:Pre-mRNA-processing factor 39 n=1 Tax=Oryzias javanicus TaxID=123683 RepID=A0A437BZE8_ORYJA|nr:hypothetical protein OJAV_G00230320 [Oryzias javanicus]
MRSSGSRGWPACHTRYDCSICQLLRCIFFVSHYLTESYLIGSMKYAKYIEVFSIDGVRNVYKRACTVHLPRKPAIHLLWAAFEEQQNMVEEARGILKSLEATIPGLAMVRLRRVNLERRHGNLEEAETLLKEALEQGRDVTEMSFYAVKLARHVMKVQRDPSKAKKILLEALERDPTNSKLYLNLLEMECSGDVTQNQAEVLACFDRAIRSPMPLDTLILFAQRKVEFLEDFGTDINTLVAAYDEQQRLQRESDSAKRKAENGCDDSLEPDAKRQRAEDGSVVAANSMTDMTANNSAYNYNWYQHYGAWGQNSWGQYGQYSQYNQYYPPPPT